MNKRCFVISPIGPDGSPTREHADDVFDFIIKPAMEELGITVYRADHTQQLGRVTEQMFRSILDEDLCIAILTFFNPNVFYELAIAQCAAKPVIILIEKGHSIPFDIHDHRAIEYDLRPRPLRDKIYVKRIMEVVRSLEAVEWKVAVPFGKDLDPLGCRRDQLTLHDKVETYGPSERWLNMLHKATSTFDLSGVSLRWWTKFAGFRLTLLNKAEQGLKVRILLLSPDNPGLASFLNPKIRVAGLPHLVAEIDGSFAYFTELASHNHNIEIRKVRNGFLSHQITKNDDTLLVSLMLYSQGTSQFPLLECATASPLYQTITSEFEAIWDANSIKNELLPVPGAVAVSS